MPRALALPAVLCALAACAGPPALPERAGFGGGAQGRGPAPVLVPLDGLLAAADAPGRTEAALADLTARAERLRARAAQLRRPVLDAATRARLAAARARRGGT
jgi:hypothetical protein